MFFNDPLFVSLIKTHLSKFANKTYRNQFSGRAKSKTNPDCEREQKKTRKVTNNRITIISTTINAAIKYEIKLNSEEKKSQRKKTNVKVRMKNDRLMRTSQMKT